MGYEVSGSVGYGVVMTDWLKELLSSEEEVEDIESLMEHIHSTLKSIFKKNKVGFGYTWGREECDFYLEHQKWGGYSDYINARDFGSAIGTCKLPTVPAKSSKES